MNTLRIICVCIFSIEFVFKVIALGFRNYLKSKWNIFDFVVLTGIIVGMFKKKQKIRGKH